MAPDAKRVSNHPGERSIGYVSIHSHGAGGGRVAKVGILVGCIIVSCAIPQQGRAQEPARAEILILGTYHMASSGNHVHDFEVDDVLSDARQREIRELIDVLRRFRPTRVAVEAEVGSRVLAERYASYLAGEYTLSANETEQVGFRLARELGHDAVYGVDVDGEFPHYRVLNYARANGRAAEFDSLQASARARVQGEADFLRTHTILETLDLMNADSTVARAVGEYYRVYLPFGERWEYAGPALLSRWYERNIRIYMHIRDLVTTPDDRILVVYGAGHLGWLRRHVLNDPDVRLRKLSDLMRTGGEGARGTHVPDRAGPGTTTGTPLRR